MKKYFFIAAAATALLFSGCSSKNPQKQPVCNIDGANAPAWICNGGANMKNGIYAVGSAEKSPLGIAFQKDEAMAVARDRIARQISLKVKNMFKRYLSSTGVGDAQTAERVSTEVSKQVAYQTLRGSKLLKTWISPKGTVYVLVGISKDTLSQIIKNTANTTFKNDEALWQEFKAKKAQDELEMEIQKEFKQ